MAPPKARFLICAEADEHGKTTTHFVRQIQFEGQNEVYLIPPHLQKLASHEKLLQSATIKGAKKILTARGTYRNPFVTLTEELITAYLDEDGNPSYMGELLEEITPPEKSAASSLLPESSERIQNIAGTEKQNNKPLTSIVKDAVIEKFSGTGRNPTAWLNTFETECARLTVPEHRQWEALRLFLEGVAVDWFNSTRILLGTNSNWESWRVSFANTFARRGWTEVCDAMYYRYTTGSLSDYVIKKLSMLLDIDPNMSEIMRVNCIVVGLPIYVRDQLDREEIDKVDKLMAKINLFDRPNRNTSNSNSSGGNFRSGFRRNFKNRSKVTFPCPYCEKKGFAGRFHLESECRIKDEDRQKNASNVVTYTNKNYSKFTPNGNSGARERGNVKIVNNTELEQLINSEMDTKN